MKMNEALKNTLLGPLSKNNPIAVQVLGICSALAVTVELKPALVMGISVTITVALANVVISFPSKLRFSPCERSVKATITLSEGFTFNNFFFVFIYDI